MPLLCSLAVWSVSRHKGKAAPLSIGVAVAVADVKATTPGGLEHRAPDSLSCRFVPTTFIAGRDTLLFCRPNTVHFVLYWNCIQYQRLFLFTLGRAFRALWASSTVISGMSSSSRLGRSGFPSLFSGASFPTGSSRGTGGGDTTSVSAMPTAAVVPRRRIRKMKYIGQTKGREGHVSSSASTNNEPYFLSCLLLYVESSFCSEQHYFFWGGLVFAGHWSAMSLAGGCSFPRLVQPSVLHRPSVSSSGVAQVRIGGLVADPSRTVLSAGRAQKCVARQDRSATPKVWARGCATLWGKGKSKTNGSACGTRSNREGSSRGGCLVAQW